MLDYAREVLRAEADAIQNIQQLIGPEFEQAVRTILEMHPGNRVVVSGMGKTSFIAMKLSATLASIGVPSFFLHPSEALHGDLGRYTRTDVAIIFSNSGETPEILKLLPYIKRIGCPLISVTSERESTLAAHSDIAITFGALREAGPLGLAPTTSTTVMLALGDALAMTVFSQLEVSKDRFAFYHPGGNLGASLLKVSDLMRRDQEHCVVPETMKARDVLHRISTTKGRPGAASIVGADGILAGVFTDGNLRRCLDQNENFLDQEISAVMTRSPIVITPEKLAPEALRLMSERKIDQLIVVDDERRPIGMIDIQDLVDNGVR